MAAAIGDVRFATTLGRSFILFSGIGAVGGLVYALGTVLTQGNVAAEGSSLGPFFGVILWTAVAAWGFIPFCVAIATVAAIIAATAAAVAKRASLRVQLWSYSLGGAVTSLALLLVTHLAFLSLNLQKALFICGVAVLLVPLFLLAGRHFVFTSHSRRY